jgi:hypothetical protein
LKTEILDVTFGEKPENQKKRKTGGKRKKTKKNRYFTEIEPYLYEFDAIESRFGIYTRKTKESLFEI